MSTINQFAIEAYDMDFFLFKTEKKVILEVEKQKLIQHAT